MYIRFYVCTYTCVLAYVHFYVSKYRVDLANYKGTLQLNYATLINKPTLQHSAMIANKH